MTYGYIRVSTDRQTTLNQEFEITEFCKRENTSIDGWIEETISGTKAYDKRALGRLLRKVRKGDLIVCTELSRLGRNLYMIMGILNLCMRKGCKVYTVKEGYRLGDDIQSKVLAFAFGLSAEIERNLISQRTKEALKLRKAEGKKLGRPVGTKNKCRKLDAEREVILDLIHNGVPKIQIAKQMGVSRKTFYNWIGERNVLI